MSDPTAAILSDLDEDLTKSNKNLVKQPLSPSHEGYAKVIKQGTIIEQQKEQQPFLFNGFLHESDANNNTEQMKNNNLIEMTASDNNKIPEVLNDFSCNGYEPSGFNYVNQNQEYLSKYD